MPTKGAKRAKPNTPTPGSPTAPLAPDQTESPSQKASDMDARHSLTSKNCPSMCCRKGDSWAAHCAALENYVNGPSALLMKKSCWQSLPICVKLQARDVRKLGLARWEDLAPETRERLCSWSPVARKLWESDFLAHNEAMVRAWIWHYLDDNLFSFGGSTQGGSLVALSSPTWEHFRALRQEFNTLRHDPRGYDCTLHRIQFHTWSRIAEHLLRRGLGQEDSVNAADLVPHYKKYLRLIVQDGERKIPDDIHDGDFRYNDDMLDPPGGAPNYPIRELLKTARQLQFDLHGLDPGSYTVRFTPIDSDKMSGFPFDKDWMEQNNPVEIPPRPPGSEEPQLVALVSDPMLVISGLDGLGYERDFTHHTSMQVVVPWTFGGEEAAPFVYPQYKKGWEDDWAKRVAERNAKRAKAILKEAAAEAEGAADPTGPANNGGASQTTHDGATNEERLEDRVGQLEDRIGQLENRIGQLEDRAGQSED